MIKQILKKKLLSTVLASTFIFFGVKTAVYAEPIATTTTSSINVMDQLSTSQTNVYTDNLIPHMTGVNTPSGTVTSSAQYADAYGWKAFDRDTSTYWNTYNNMQPNGGHWLKYDFGENNEKKISKLTITPHIITGSQYGLKQFQLYASNDNINYVQLFSGEHANNDLKETYVFNNNQKYRYYKIVGINSYPYNNHQIVLDEVEMMEENQLITSIDLNKNSVNLLVGNEEILVLTVLPDNTSNKNIAWTSSDSTIATVDNTGKVTAIKAGVAIIKAITQDGTNLSASCEVVVTDAITNKVVLNIEPERNKIKKSETVTANLVIDNITNIAAEDIRIKYDAEKLQFVNFVEVDGIKLVKNDVKTGELRFILASKGKDNIADAKKILLKLNFKGIAVGEALVDVVKGRVSDGIEMEKDLTDENCGQATIIIEGIKDVNNSGGFTLLDLAIDARHLGENPTTFPQYNTDVVENGAIDDEDLLEIGNQMLLNPNYEF